MRTCEQLELNTLKSGARFQVATEPWNPRYNGELVRYDLLVINQGEEPLCEISGPNEHGKVVTYRPVVVDGAGFITTIKENPTQAGDWLFGRPYKPTATTIHHGKIIVGGSFMVYEPNTHPVKRAELGRKCMEIIVYEDPPSAA